MFVSRERVATGLPKPCRFRAVGNVAGQVWVSITGEVCKGGDHQVSRGDPQRIWRITVAENRSRLFGGHPFRVAGAQRLATIGVEIAKIMVMARRTGSTLLRYVKEAPLANLSSEVVAFEKHNCLVQSIQRLKAEFAVLAEQVAAQTTGATSTLGRLQREIDEGSGKLQKHCAPIAEKRILSRCGAGRHKVHLAMVVAEGGHTV